MNYISSGVRSALKLLTPSFYTGNYRQLLTQVKADHRAGSPAPFFKFMVAVGFLGYSAEYLGAGSEYKQHIF